MSFRLLLISDEPSVGLRAAAESEDFRVQTCALGAEAIRLAVQTRPDLLIVDCTADESNALQLCRSLRSMGEASAIPLIALKGAHQEESHLRAFAAGADDCLTSPVTGREIHARFLSIKRRFHQVSRTDVISYADVELDPERHRVRRDGKLVRLTTMQLRLLRHLMENPTIVFSRQQLLEQVWADSSIHEGAVTACVVRLRRALNASGGPNLIRSVPSAGYALDEEFDG